MKQHIITPFRLDRKKLNLCLVNKLPLDLNEKSRIVLVTVYNEKIKVNVFTFHHLFKSFGDILKIVIFKKKNYQVFIEFSTSEQAVNFKQSLHNINYKGYFFVKIQFTQKKELIVNSNSQYEYDFFLKKSEKLDLKNSQKFEKLDSMKIKSLKQLSILEFDDQNFDQNKSSLKQVIEANYE